MMEKKTANLSIERYKNKIEKRITFRAKIGFYLEFLTPETMKFLKSTKGEMKIENMYPFRNY